MLHECHKVSIKINGDNVKTHHPPKWQDTLNIMLSLDSCEIFIEHSEGERVVQTERFLWPNRESEQDFLDQWTNVTTGGWVEEYINKLKNIYPNIQSELR